ncbi:MAG: AAA family ATPase [Planctomycetia bacterium]
MSSFLPSTLHDNEAIDVLFDRVNTILGDNSVVRPEVATGSAFIPRQPRSLREANVSPSVMERIIMRFLLQASVLAGRRIATQLKLPYKLVEPVLKQLRQEKHIDLSGTTTAGDSEFVLTNTGRDRARQYVTECSYFGAAPVPLADYAASVKAQSPSSQQISMVDLHRAFRGLTISESMLSRLGPALRAGRGLFLYGQAGNGKTSIAERITEAFGSTIWIPRAVAVDSDVIRIFDPTVHVEAEEFNENPGLLDSQDIDRRWVRIRRPTIIAGGELTMRELEIQINPTSRVCEAPLQVKSNCGTLVIDDFGRQRMPVEELLNRWIIPLEKRHDYLNLPTGKKVQFPFDQLMIFSTNLEPGDLVDAAFLRRIPYKIEVPDPTEEQFRNMLESMSAVLGIPYNRESCDYLIEQHYRKSERPFRACQPRDLLQQVKYYCLFHEIPVEMSPTSLDAAVLNYFSIMQTLSK